MEILRDIELSLNFPSPPDPAPAWRCVSKCGRKEREMPLWDIELDKGAALTTDDDENMISSDEADEETAPALHVTRL